MKLYIYDHCPYCVKARMIFGFHNQNMELVYLPNDDEKTPISMIGEKMVPILELSKQKFMPESLDIISFIDKNSKKPMLTKKQNKALSSWLNTNSSLCYQLAMPRWPQAPLEEFKTKSARDYFIKKKEAYIGPFEDCLNNTDVLLSQIEEALEKLSSLFDSDFNTKKGMTFINGSLSLDDFHLFVFLRSLSIVKALKFPSFVKKYMDFISEKSKTPLHFDIAL